MTVGSGVVDSLHVYTILDTQVERKVRTYSPDFSLFLRTPTPVSQSIVGAMVPSTVAKSRDVFPCKLDGHRDIHPLVCNFYSRFRVFGNACCLLYDVCVLHLSDDQVKIPPSYLAPLGVFDRQLLSVVVVQRKCLPE